jgi:hypothetical protein
VKKKIARLQGLQDYKIARLQGLQNYKIAGLQDWKIKGL